MLPAERDVDSSGVYFVVKTQPELLEIVSMNTPRSVLLIAVLILLPLGRLSAAPIEFSEISLLVRAHENNAFIMQQVSHRKLLRPLTSQQENTLKAQGANDSLVQSLRQNNLALSPADASTFEAQREQLNKPRPAAASFGAEGANSETQDGLQVFEVSAGHPINLSQWGGPDYEFAFRGTTRFDDGCPEASIVDNVRSFTHVATYLGAGRPDDSTTVFDRRNYVSIMDHAFSRGVFVDYRNPIRRKGVPYTLYPLYAAGGVSLYYISSSSDTVRLAVARR